MANTRHLFGIVLDRKNHQENDQIIFFYSREAGKTEILIRGGRKINSKLAPIVAEPFALLDLVVAAGRNNFHLIGGEVKKSFRGIYQSEKKINQVNILFKKISGLINNQSDQKIFPLILKFLEKMDRLSEEKIKIIINAFLIKFLAFLGYCPEIRKCLICGMIPGDKEIVFDPVKGGILCLRHALDPNMESRGIKINQGIMDVLQSLLYRDFNTLINRNFKQEDLSMAVKTLKEFFNWHLG